MSSDWREHLDDLPNQHEVRRETARFSGFAITAGVGAIVVILALGWFAFGAKVFTSDLRGQGDAITTKNSGTNRVAAQERFESLYQEIQAADRRIDVLTDAAERAPESQVAQTNLTGAITFCQSVVAAYNAEARKYTAREFRATDLPEQVDNTDPATDCKETAR